MEIVAKIKVEEVIICGRRKEVGVVRHATCYMYRFHHNDKKTGYEMLASTAALVFSQ